MIMMILSLLFFLAAFVYPSLALGHAPAETLVVAPWPPTLQDAAWTMGREGLRARAFGTARTTTSTTTGTAAQGETTPASPTSPLPEPLDGNLSTNMTNDCAAFIEGFLAAPTFKQCYPFSMLLQGSSSFFDAEKSLASITQVIDASCTANVTFCANYLAQLSTNLTLPSNCLVEYEESNAVVVDSYVGMLAYAPLYTAACLKNAAKAEYCYADAITNTTNPSNAYFYYLPLNISLPAGTVPSCNACLQDTMDMFRTAAANRQQPIANTYVAAAQQANALCGPAFVNATLPPVPVASSAVSRLRQPGSSSLAVAGVSLLLAAALSCFV